MTFQLSEIINGLSDLCKENSRKFNFLSGSPEFSIDFNYIWENGVSRMEVLVRSVEKNKPDRWIDAFDSKLKIGPTTIYAPIKKLCDQWVTKVGITQKIKMCFSVRGSFPNSIYLQGIEYD